MTEPVGPIFAAGFQHITKSGYEILYLAELHNDELQREGKQPIYYWLPNTVRLARQNGDNGDYKFSFIHFEGRRTNETSIGVAGTQEVTGGLLGFSTTAAPPASVLQESQDELLNRFRGNDDKYWGWRTPVAPMFRPAPILSNTTSITNLSPNPDGTVPATGAGGAQGPGAPGGGPPGGGKSLKGNRLRELQAVTQPPIFAASQRSVALKRDAGSAVPRPARDTNLDMWYANLQGQGSGSVSPFAENAYSGLVGSLPAALIWSSFHGGTGGISVWQKMKIKVWSPVVHLHIEGDWDKIQAHLSAAGHYGGLFWGGDIQAQFNYMSQNGMITVVTEVDTTLPNADKLQEELNKRTDLVFQKFMDAAQKTIFEPAAFNEKPAEASGGFLGFGGGVAFKLRVDMTHLHLAYDERKEMAYLQEYPISGQLEGFYDEIKADPSAEKKYFTTLYIDDWERAVIRQIAPVVNWPDASKQWVGEPVAFLSAQVGYPDTNGAIQWEGHLFQQSEGPNAHWESKMAMKNAGDVSNAPAGWTPDKTFVKRQIHFTEPPNESEYPYARVSVEKNIIDLDPGDNGRLINDINLEVRVDNVGTLSVGPIILDLDLETPKQMVEVTFKALGQTDDGNERAPVTFLWKYEDQTEPRFWMIFTGQPTFLPKFQYQVHCIEKGSFSTKGREWFGPWEDASGNGPRTISVPLPGDPGVQTRNLVPGAATAKPSPTHGSPPPHPAPVGAGTPPSTKSVGYSSAPSSGGVKEVGGWPVSSSKGTPPPAAKKAVSKGTMAEEPIFSGYSTEPPHK